MLLIAAAPTATKGPLDGMSFTGQTGEKGKEKGDAETFQFSKGMFDPQACHAWGFAATPYKAKTSKEGTTFEAEHTNAKGERMKWSGTVKGDTLSGTMTYWDASKKPTEYWFKATKKK
jgi:hypothetical protein